MKSLVRTLWDLPLSWLMIPVVLGYTLFFGLIQLLLNLLEERDQEYWGRNYRTSRDYRDVMFDLLEHAPMWNNYDINTYAPGLRFNERPNGWNHSTDTQVNEAALYFVAYMKIFKKPQHRMIESLHANIRMGELRRGFYVKDGKTSYSDKPVSGEQLVAYCFAYMHGFRHGNWNLQMARLSQHLIRNQGLLTCGEVSPLANYLPIFKCLDVEPSLVDGKQHLPYLAGVLAGLKASQGFDRHHRKIYGVRSPWYFRYHYWKRLYLYGAFLSVMFPTTTVDDSPTLQAAYICHKVTRNPIFLASALWTWALGGPNLNGFHAGMVYEMTGGKFPSVTYMLRCLKRACHGAHKSVLACLADITWSILR